MTSYLQIAPAKVERALIDLIEVFTQPGPNYTLTAAQWERVLPLAGMPAMGQHLSMDELKTIRAHALANAQEWIESHNVNDAVQVAIARKCLEEEPDPIDRIHVIASELEPLNARWSNAMSAPDPGETLQAAVDAFNAAMERHVQEISRITPNSESTLRMAFGPQKRFDVWFQNANSPYQFLRDLALHKSFNQEYASNQTRNMAQELLRARVPAGAECMSLKDAVQAIAAGKVPVISAKDLPPRSMDLERQLFKAGLLESYSGFFVEAYSPVGHIAYVLRHAPESAIPDDFVFWPKNRARNQIVVTPLVEPVELQQEQSPAPAP